MRTTLVIELYSEMNLSWYSLVVRPFSREFWSFAGGGLTGSRLTSILWAVQSKAGFDYSVIKSLEIENGNYGIIIWIDHQLYSLVLPIRLSKLRSTYLGC